MNIYIYRIRLYIHKQGHHRKPCFRNKGRIGIVHCLGNGPIGNNPPIDNKGLPIPIAANSRRLGNISLHRGFPVGKIHPQQGITEGISVDTTQCIMQIAVTRRNHRRFIVIDKLKGNIRPGNGQLYYIIIYLAAFSIGGL